jgi:biopolymer transport protein ExbD
MSMMLPSKGPRAEINVTPMIDVLLVLLIVFMIVVPTKSVGLQANVPQPPTDSAPPQQEDRSIVLKVGTDGAVSINTEATDLFRLGDRLAEIFKSRADKALFVTAANGTEFQHVARAIDIAKGAGVDRIGLLGADFQRN